MYKEPSLRSVLKTISWRFLATFTTFSLVWITGLSCSGKTEVAKIVTRDLRKRKFNTDHLHGETIRNIFARTGFSRDEVNRHIERAGLLASRFEKNGVFVVASFISPFGESREFVRSLCDNFIEIHLSTPLEYCEKIDYNNLYSRARRGEVKNLAGVDVEYEDPASPDPVLDASELGIEKAAEKVNLYLRKFM